MHLLQEPCPVVTFCLEECTGSVHGDVAVSRLHLIIMELNPRVSIKALAGGQVEKQGGVRETLCDEELFNLVLEELRDPAASCPQFDEIAGSCTEAVQHGPPDLRWNGQLNSGGVFVCHWT